MTPNELRDWRTTHHMSQGQLALALGVDAMTVSRWERGVRQIPPFLHLALKALTPVPAASALVSQAIAPPDRPG